MTFTCDYRDRNGARKSEVVEAQNRADCFAKLKARGINPMSVREGGKPSASSSSAGGARPSGVVKGAIGGVVVIAIAVVVYLFVFSSKPEGKVAQPNDKTVHKSKQEAVPRPKAAPVQKPVKVESKVDTPKPVKAKETNRVEKLPDGREIRINEKGEKVLCVNPVDPNAPVPEPKFKHEVESALAMYVTPAVDMPPPPKDYTDEEVRKALAEPITIDMNEDDEDTIYQKKTVQAFKDELKEFLENGGTFAGYLRQLQKRQEKEAIQMRESRKMIEKCLDEDKPDEAKELFDALNKHLSEQGIPPIKMTPKYRGRLPGVNDTKVKKENGHE